MLNEFQGINFQGGGQGLFGSSFYGRTGVNYVYARTTGAVATMTATFQLTAVPETDLFLVLEAMDDDAAAPCPIQITVNGEVIFDGPSGFPDAVWLRGQYRLPAAVLQAGTNQLSIGNQSATGNAGNPPWFMLARAALADASYRLPPPPSATNQFRVTLPSAPRPFPEPLPSGQTQPGFALRGTKGWNWDPEQYLAEIPFLAAVKMNFLMNCYLSLFSSRPPNGWANEWWLPLPETTKTAYAEVIERCQSQGVTFCFAMNPQLFSSRPLIETNLTDIDDLYQHYAWAQSLGVRWFSICLDDVSWIGRGSQHAYLVNAVFNQLRQVNPEAQMIFCPGPYWGDGTESHARAYLETLARDLHPEVCVFWTGNEVVGQRITYAAAASYRSIVQRRLILWDNYPVNDGNPTLHLGPVAGRDTNLCLVIEGYMGNPLWPQNEINRLPLATCADYAFNPWSYDPDRSIGQALFQLGSTTDARETLRDLVEAYPGFLVTGGGTGANAVRNAFSSMEATARGEFMDHLQNLLNRLMLCFPDQFSDARQTLANDLAWMQSARGPQPVHAASADGRQLTLVLNGGVARAAATNPANYRLVGGTVVSGQWLPAPDTNVLVLTTTDLNRPAYFALTGTGISDSQGNPGLLMALGDVEEFTVQSIGVVRNPAPVNAAPAPETWLVYTRGDDIFGVNDGFNYLYRLVSGNFDKVLRINHVGSQNEWTRGGLMVRQDTTAGSPNLMVGTYPDGTALWLTSWRATPDSATLATLAPRSAAFPDAAWVRLQRMGNTFLSSYRAGDESAGWSLLSSNVLNMPADVLLGMAASSIDNAGGGNARVRFEFSHFRDFFLPRPSLQIHPVGEAVVIRWATNVAADLVLQQTSQLGSSTDWTSVNVLPEMSGTNFQVTLPVAVNPQFFRLTQ